MQGLYWHFCETLFVVRLSSGGPGFPLILFRESKYNIYADILSVLHNGWVPLSNIKVYVLFEGPWSLRSLGDRLSPQNCADAQERASGCQDVCHWQPAQTSSRGNGQQNSRERLCCRRNKKRVDDITATSPVVYLPVLLLAQLEKCAQDLGSTSKAVGSSMAQLLTCAAQGNEHYTGRQQVAEA